MIYVSNHFQIYYFNIPLLIKNLYKKLAAKPTEMIRLFKIFCLLNWERKKLMAQIQLILFDFFKEFLW